MIAGHHTKLVHEGNYVAEVNVKIMDAGKGWSLYLFLQDAYKLDEVREALRQGDLKRATKSARVYRLDPVSV